MRRNCPLSFLIIILALTKLSALDWTLRTFQRSGSTYAETGNYSIAFGTISTHNDLFVAPAAIQFVFDHNDGLPWKIDAYTDNDNYTDYVQKGGLTQLATLYPGTPQQSTATVRLPLGWTTSGSLTEMSWGDPNMASSDWVWLKDINDLDIDVTSGTNESWDAASAAGYVTICEGNSARQIYSRNKLLPGNSVYVYLEADMRSALFGDYTGTIWFDLYIIPDDEPPTVTHVPIGDIMRGNRIVFDLNATDDRLVREVLLHYQLDSSSWQVTNLALSGTDASKTARYAMTPPLVKRTRSLQAPTSETPIDQSISYWLEVYDGYNRSYYPTTAASPAAAQSDPQIIRILREMAFADILAGTIIVPDGNPTDGNTSLKIPAGALSSPITVTVRSLELEDVPEGRFGFARILKKPVTVYEISPDGKQFQRPIELTLRYNDFDNDGFVELADGTVTEIKETDLQICWWDGFIWRNMGGKVDTSMNTVTIRTDHFSTYALFPAAEKTAADYKPAEKILTPASPGMNDFAYFTGLEGTDFKINIYEINGRKIRSIVSPQLPKWDGRDENGNLVESGVYIYQFEAEIAGNKKLLSGTIIIAK